MLPADALRRLARRLSGSADRVTTLAEGAARHAAEVQWECPRGRRAADRAGELAGRAWAEGDHLRLAARGFERAADELDHL
jgi:hypothetical protein